MDGINVNMSTLTLRISSEGFWSVELTRKQPAALLQEGVGGQRALQQRRRPLQSKDHTCRAHTPSQVKGHATLSLQRVKRRLAGSGGSAYNEGKAD